MAAFPYHMPREAFEGFLIPDIPCEPVARPGVDDVDDGPFPPEGFRRRFSDPVRAAGNDGDFVFEHSCHGLHSPWVITAVIPKNT